jgi:hypothetical protein
MAYINLTIIYFAGLLSFLYYFYRIRMIKYIEFLMICIVLAGLIYALSTKNEPFKIFTGLIRPLFFLAMVKVFALGFNKIDKQNLFNFRYANALMFSYVIGVSVVGFLYFTVGGVRASATAIALALPFFFFILHRCYIRAALCVILFLVGGKLGPFVGVLAALTLIVLSSFKRVVLLIGFSIFLCVIVMVLPYISDFDVLRIPVVAKLNLNVIFDGNLSAYNLDRFVLGGRLSEAYSAIMGVSVNYEVEHWVFGGGLGYTYLWSDFNDVVIREANSGVHFSPIAVFCVYGLPFALLFFLYLGKYLFQSINILTSSKKHDMATVMWAAFLVASCVNALTAYSLFTNLMMAVSIGYLQKVSRDNKLLKAKKRLNINTQPVQVAK